MTIGSSAARAAATASNVIEVLRFGGLRTGETPLPYEVAAVGKCYRLLRYGTAGATKMARPAAILIPPLMLTYRVYDVSENASAIQTLLDADIDVWVVDFGTPERVAGGMSRTLSDHIHAISEVVDHVADHVDDAVHLVGYSQGGMFCYQTAAFRRGARIASVISFGSPVDLRTTSPMKMPEPVAVATAKLGAPVVGRGVPGWITRSGFQMLDPVGTVKSQLDFLLALHDREALLPREGQRQYLMRDGWIGWPGPALQEFLRQFVVSNRMLSGGFTISGVPVTLADIQVPILAFLGAKDSIAPPASVRAIHKAAPRALTYERELPTGHFGLVVGRNATTGTWPLVAEWMRWHSCGEPSPDSVYLVQTDTETAASEEPVGVGTLTSTLTRAAAVIRSAVGVADAAPAQLRRVSRLSSMQPSSHVSVGRLLSQRAHKSPTATALLFGDKAYSYAAVNETVDVVVDWLLQLGVRRGDAVGVLMETRPSAVATIVALNRIGTVAVLLRPGSAVADEVALAQVSRVLADPDHSDVDLQVPVHRFLLDTPDVPDVPSHPDALTATTRDRTASVEAFIANPGRYVDAAFVYFTGHDAALRAHTMSNGQFVRTALGAAASAQLSSGDTIYATGALHHPLGLLALVGAAMESGCRVAMASASDVDTFWEEVRRYGVTVVSYTWAQLLPLVQAYVHPGESHHHIRLFIGAGMPRGVWRRVVERFPTANVLEMWTSVRTEVILANVRGAKIGSVGRPLPGSPAIRLAQFDVATRQLIRDRQGFARECGIDESGQLLVQARADEPVRPGDLRDVFSAGDSWRATGALFRRDAEGDYWLVDRISDLVQTPDGYVAGHPAAEAVGELAGVGLVAAFRAEGGLALAATVDGPSFAADRLARAALDVQDPPIKVCIVNDIPLTSAHRPDVLAHSVATGDATMTFRLDRVNARYVGTSTRIHGS